MNILYDDLLNSKCLFYLGSSWSWPSKDSDSDFFVDYYYSYDLKTIVYFTRNCLEPREKIEREIDLSSYEWFLNVFTDSNNSLVIIQNILDTYLSSVELENDITSYENLRNIALLDLPNQINIMVEGFKEEYTALKYQNKRERKLPFWKKKKKN